VRPRAEPQPWEKIWRISIVQNKRSVRFAAQRETICRKGRYRLGTNDRARRAAPRNYVDQTEIATACLERSDEKCGYLSLKLDAPSFNVVPCAVLLGR
jgi:uncharacterized protein (DUF736 family)